MARGWNRKEINEKLMKLIYQPLSIDFLFTLSPYIYVCVCVCVNYGNESDSMKKIE